MLSLSTAYHYSTSSDMCAMLSRTKELGFDFLELGYQISGTHLKEIIRLLPEFDLGVSDVHNYCPVPDDGPSRNHTSNYYYLSSRDDQERQKAVHWTKESIHTAKRLGAKAVVIHAGTIEWDNNEISLFMDWARAGRIHTPEFDELRKKILDKREKRKNPFMDALEASLQELLPFAQKQGVFIGLETRYYPHEIPDSQEIGYFLEKFSDCRLRYWHDIGHGEVIERFGIGSHQDILKNYQKHLIGVHLHGMRGIDDHGAPFQGDFDLKPYLKYFPDHLIRVIEAHPKASSQHIKEAVCELS